MICYVVAYCRCGWIDYLTYGGFDDWLLFACFIVCCG